MPQSMAHSQAGPVEYRSVGDGCEMDRQIGSLSNGWKSMVLLFEPQADLVTGQALFVNSFPLSLAVRLNSLSLPEEPGASWRFPANGPPGQPREPDYPAHSPNEINPKHRPQGHAALDQRPLGYRLADGLFQTFDALILGASPQEALRMRCAAPDARASAS